MSISLAKQFGIDPSKYKVVLTGGTVNVIPVERSVLTLTNDIIGDKETTAVIRKLGHTLTVFTAKALAHLLADTLALSQPTVPIDTGKLRESGRAIIRYVGGSGTYNIVARGKRSGTVEVDLTKITSNKVKNAREILGEIDYSRLSDDRRIDVAIFTHEFLNPFGSKVKPRARTPGTGPKYLENAWNKSKKINLPFFIDAIAGVKMENDLSKLLRRKSLRYKNYILDYVDIVHII